MPNALCIEIRQDIVTTKYRRANHVSSVGRLIRTADHLVVTLGSNQFYDDFRVAARTNHNYRWKPGTLTVSRGRSVDVLRTNAMFTEKTFDKSICSIGTQLPDGSSIT